MFLAWLNDEERDPGEMDGVREIVDRHKRRDCRIFTSVLTSIEVLHAKIPAGVDTLFDGLLKRLTRASVDSKVAQLARDIRNHYHSAALSLRVPDAIHLATAILYRADELHTFDEKLIGYSGDVGGHRLTVCKPVARNLQLDLRG